MMNNLRMSTYHISIVSVYVLLCVYFFFFTKLSQTLFIFKTKDLTVIFPFTICAIATFFVANYFLQFGVFGLNRRNISRLPVIILYASILIAIPEEILFRGIVQAHLSSFFSNIIISITITSLLFGLAHCLNGSKGFRISQWNWKLIAMTFIAGIFLGLTFYMTGSLVVPVVLHSLFVVAMKLFINDVDELASSELPNSHLGCKFGRRIIKK